ncbi:MAG: hypothetical protein ACRCXL_16970 [Dermatophilaceae bacterium]
MIVNEILETALTAAAAGAVLAPAVALMERTHRRSAADHGGRAGRFTDRYTDDRDADARRVSGELRARAGEDLAVRAATTPAVRSRRDRTGSTRERTHHRRGVRTA